MPRGTPKHRPRDWASRTGDFGELNGHNNWSDKEAKMIREYREGGFSFEDLRKLFGGSTSTLADLCNGKTYKTAGGPIAGVDYPKGQYAKSLL
jgi:hypothetical protein